MLLPALLLLSGCGTLGKLSEVGRPPAMTPSGDPTADPSYRPITLPMPRAQSEPAEANSLWRAGSRAFFKDQRAAQVGDIVTVLVNITDTADLKNRTAPATAPATRPRACRACSGSRRHCRRSCPNARPGFTGVDQQQGHLGRHRFHQAERDRDTAPGWRDHPGAAERQPGRRRAAGSAGQLGTARAAGQRRDPAAGHRQRQHGPPRPPGRGTHRLWWPRADQRRAARRATASRSWTSCCRSDAPAWSRRGRRVRGPHPCPNAFRESLHHGLRRAQSSVARASRDVVGCTQGTA